MSGGAAALTDGETAPDPLLDELTPDDPVLPCQRDTHWVGISVRYEDDLPAEDVCYRITLPDGTPREGKTDARGRAVVRPIEEAGSCTVAFPAIDDAFWWRLGAGRPGPMVEGRAEGDDHPVKDGDGVSVLAMRAGLRAETLWQHPRNSELQRHARHLPAVPDRGARVLRIVSAREQIRS
jgi:hypothetical protein